METASETVSFLDFAVHAREPCWWCASEVLYLFLLSIADWVEKNPVAFLFTTRWVGVLA